MNLRTATPDTPSTLEIVLKNVVQNPVDTLLAAAFVFCFAIVSAVVFRLKNAPSDAKSDISLHDCYRSFRIVGRGRVLSTILGLNTYIIVKLTESARLARYEDGKWHSTTEETHEH